MDREEFIGKLQLCYVGDRNALEEIVSVYDELQQRISKAKDLSDEIYNFIKCKNSNLFYEIEDLLIEQDEILDKK